MNIREMRLSDIPGLCEIDSRLFKDSWHENFFEDEIKKAYASCFTAEENGIICGYAVVWCIYETAELIRIAVDGEYQKCGIGGSLLEKLLETAENAGCEKMLLEVRETNGTAQRLYKRYGFGQISVRKKYYEGAENALIFEKELMKPSDDGENGTIH